MIALVDTNFVYALFDKRDQHNAEAKYYFAYLREELLLPTVILAEVSYHLHQVKRNREVAQAFQRLRKSPFILTDPHQPITTVSSRSSKSTMTHELTLWTHRSWRWRSGWASPAS